MDVLNIHALSASNLGDTNGMMSYSNGQSNVFIDLSHAGNDATLGDAFVNATTTLDVNYMATGAGGAVTQEAATISVGGTTGYADTVQGLISAINNANLGLTASFTIAAQAGQQATAAGAATDAGILISGQGAGVGSGTTPGSVCTLAISGANSLATDPLVGTFTVTDSSGTVHTITLGQAGTNNLSNLANTINAAGYGITASYSAAIKDIVFTSASSKAAITGSGLADGNNGGGAMLVS